MAQFYTKERTVTGASPKIYDESQRILTEAENIIESMRALRSIEEQQNATLINNLRAHRQRDKELNTRNHQLLMDNMKQVAEAQQRKDQNDLNNANLKRKEEIAQEQRTMQTLSTLSQTAAKFAGAMIEDGIQKATDDAREDLANGIALNPQATEGTAYALDVQLAEDERVLDKPKKPQFLVMKYDDSAIVVRLRLYSHTKDWYAVYTDLMRKLKPALDEAGIQIPYPHRVIAS